MLAALGYCLSVAYVLAVSLKDTTLGQNKQHDRKKPELEIWVRAFTLLGSVFSCLPSLARWQVPLAGVSRCCVRRGVSSQPAL